MTRRTPQIRPARPGFTLVELLVVISIIAVLISLLAPALSSARDQATIARELARGRDNALAYQMFASDHREYLVMARTELMRAIPEPLRERPRDLSGRPLSGLQARNWFWRLAPYLEDNLQAFYRDSEHLQAISDRGATNYYLSTWYPAFGINHRFVGGEPDYYPAERGSGPTRTARLFGDDFWVRRMTDPMRPSRLLAMASAATYEPTAGRVVEGFYQVNPPAFSDVNAGDAWTSIAPPEPGDDPGQTGNVAPVAAGAVVGVHLDGHAESYPWDEIATDMRLWAPGADAPGWRLQADLR